MNFFYLFLSYRFEDRRSCSSIQPIDSKVSVPAVHCRKQLQHSNYQELKNIGINGNSFSSAEYAKKIKKTNGGTHHLLRLLYFFKNLGCMHIMEYETLILDGRSIYDFPFLLYFSLTKLYSIGQYSKLWNEKKRIKDSSTYIYNHAFIL